MKGKDKGGRPLLGAEPKQRYQVMLEPKIAAKLRKLGGNNLSRGIVVAFERSLTDNQ